MTDLASQANDRKTQMDEMDQYDRIDKLRTLMDKKARIDFCARTLGKEAGMIYLIQQSEGK